MSDNAPLILLDSYSGGDFNHSWRFRGYLETLVAKELSEVLPLLAKVERFTADGFHAAGFIAYEAASGLNPDLPSSPVIEGLPLAWFAIFSERIEALLDEQLTPEALSPPQLEPDITYEKYVCNVERIKEYIASGDSYQVNYTFGMKGDFSGDPLELYRQISRGQKASFSAYIDTGRFALLSASPELFFSLKEGQIRVRPMKGTAARGRWSEEDEEHIARLKSSIKERAENLMIVDLLRNDLGMIAETGSVKVESLFDVETFPTLHQMTSGVSAKVKKGAGLAEIFTALFPCGSVTGAPKRRSMEIINELEPYPRGLYCGAVGYVAPGGEALFSVAIRSLLFDRQKQSLFLGIGSAITADSDPGQEYQECLTKAAFLSSSPGDFCLIESMRLEGGSYYLLNRHLERLRKSAGFFGFSFDRDVISAALQGFVAGEYGVCKVRLLLQKNGEFTLSSESITESSATLRIAISDQRADSSDLFRYHKTNRREKLDSARKARKYVDEVLFLNERGELTEGSYHNLLLKINGKMLTPRRDSGLLNGVLRQELLERGEIVEAILFPADLAKADEIWLINSVRGMRRAVLIL